MEKTLNTPYDESRQATSPRESYEIRLRRTEPAEDNRIRKPKKVFTDHQTPDENLNAIYWG